jgi:hypothetical protein
MAKNNNTTAIVLLAAAAGAWLLFRNSGQPRVSYNNIDWLNGTALITVNGKDEYINTSTGIGVGDYTVTLDKNYWPQTDRVEATQLVVRKNGAIVKIIANRY